VGFISVAARVIDRFDDVENAPVGRERLPLDRHDDAVGAESEEFTFASVRSARHQPLDAAVDAQSGGGEQSVERHPPLSRARLVKSDAGRRFRREGRAMNRRRRAVNEAQAFEDDEWLFAAIGQSRPPFAGTEGEEAVRHVMT
jgi:hypothetical protein